MKVKDKLIVSLDVDHFDQAFHFVNILSPVVDCFKVGIGPYTAFGDKLLDLLVAKNKKVFLDLKFHDIPNTVKSAVKAATDKNIFMLNVHALGGAKMLLAAREGIAASNNKNKPLLIAVTILTSMHRDDLKEINLTGDTENNVLNLANLAQKSGLDGVVASAQEAAIIKQYCGEGFIIVTPGIRPKESSLDDQARAVTPEDALKNGADFLVVGRPILKSLDPIATTQQILKEIEHANTQF